MKKISMLLLVIFSFFVFNINVYAASLNNYLETGINVSESINVASADNNFNSFLMNFKNATQASSDLINNMKNGNINLGKIKKCNFPEGYPEGYHDEAFCEYVQLNYMNISEQAAYVSTLNNIRQQLKDLAKDTDDYEAAEAEILSMLGNKNFIYSLNYVEEYLKVIGAYLKTVDKLKTDLNEICSNYGQSEPYCYLDIDNIVGSTNSLYLSLNDEFYSTVKNPWLDEYWDYDEYTNDIVDCGLLGGLQPIIQEIFDWIKIIAPVLVIGFGAIDFAKATTAADADKMKAATKSFMTRLLMGILLFFLPGLLNLILTWAGIFGGTCGVQ